jgi:two-component sensor histidine kinase
LSSRSLSIWQALLGLTLSVALPLILLATFLMSQSLSSERNAVRDGHLAAARAFASLVDNEVETHVALAAALAASPALRNRDLASFHAQAAEVARNVVRTWISLSDRSGTLLLSTLQPYGVPLPPRTGSRSISEAAVASRSPMVSDVIQGEISGQHIAVLEYPVILDGDVAYTITIALHPETFRRLIDQKFGANAAVAVIDRQRRFVARIPDHDNRVGTPAAVSWVAAIDASPSEGLAESVTLEGVSSLTSYASTHFGWIAGISYPLSTLYAPVNRQLWLMVTLSSAIVLAASALAYWFSRRLGWVLIALARDAGNLSKGEVVKPAQLGIREADEVSRVLSVSSEALRSHLDQLELARGHQAFLLGELAHRLKNQLAVISSMIRQTRRGRSSLEEFADVLNNRIQGLAVGVDLLVGQSWLEAPIVELVNRQVEPFVPAGERLTLSGPILSLRPELTQSIGLAIHELATNAVKYGAWSAADGIVQVTWDVEHLEHGRALSMSWRELGGPPVTQPQRHGFGQIVIQQAAGRGNGCFSEIRYEPAGILWHMRTILPPEA